MVQLKDIKRLSLKCKYYEDLYNIIWELNTANKITINDSKDIKIINTNRGGKITLHNPGQKIIYFVLNLNNRRKDIRKLIKMIEKSIIEFLISCKIKGKNDKKNIGIWVNQKKIAAIGLRVSRWIAYHGCSINIKNNLNDYLKIVPCGLDNKKITSVLHENGIVNKDIDKKLKKIFIKNICKI